MSQVVVDLLQVVGGQDRIDVREVLVQGRAADAGCFRNPRHGDSEEPLVQDQPPSAAGDR
jgi:hypothetical protein